MVSPFEGKTEFSEKNDKNSPTTGSGWINPLMVTSQFFHEFPGSLKFQDEMPGAGKRGEAGAYATRKNHKKIGRTDTQTDTSSWKPGVAEKEAPSAQSRICLCDIILTLLFNKST